MSLAKQANPNNGRTLKQNPAGQLQDGNQNHRNWIDLPDDVTASILSRLGAIEILVTALNVCTTWRRICKDPRNWRTIDMCDVSVYDKSPSRYRFDVFCAKAIDLSCGNLVDISVQNFGSNGLLKHITDSCRGIRRLCFVSSDVTSNGLIKAASKLPLLEDLELSYCDYRLKFFENLPGKQIHGYLEVIGRSCPRLKSLKLNKYKSKCLCDERDGDALAIAGSMHGLHHLQLFGNKLTSEGLRAILDGCPLLESLDLRHCFNLNVDQRLPHGRKLDVELRRRCSDHIEKLRLPYDSKHDYVLPQKNLSTRSSRLKLRTGASCEQSLIYRYLASWSPSCFPMC